MFFGRIRNLFHRAEDVSAAVLLLVYPCCLLATSAMYPVWERHGIRFQVLCNSALVAFAIIICSKSALSRFVVWFRHSIFIYLLPLWLIGLSLMGWWHGFGFADPHHQGLVSGLLGALCVPFVCYAMYSVRSFWIFKVLGLLTIVINVLECIFLGFYSHYGVMHNATFALWGEELPRIFLNTRDGGAWCLLLIGFVYVLWCNVCDKYFPLAFSIRNVFMYSVLLIPAYLLALLTSSRGVFVSVAFALLVVRFFRLMRRNAWVYFFIINAVSTICAFALRLAMGASLAQASDSGVRMVQVDQTRLHMWFAWFKAISLHPQDWLLGKGFNFVPIETLPPGQWPSNVHNLYLQILVDSGLLGVLIVSISVITAFKFLLPILSQSFHMTAIIYFGLSLLFVYSAVSAIIDWPSGCWIAFLVMSVALGLTSNPYVSASNARVSSSGEVLPEKYDLLLKLLSFVMFFGFLFLQVPLVAARYTYLVPDIFKNSMSL